MKGATPTELPQHHGDSLLSGGGRPLIVDGEALLPGPRGRMAVTVSVRFLDRIEVWLYAAELALDRPARGLWRWRQGAWQRLSGSPDLDPCDLVRTLTDPGVWLKPPPAMHRDIVLDLLRSTAFQANPAGCR